MKKVKGKNCYGDANYKVNGVVDAICAGIGASTSATALAASTIKSLSVKEITFMKNVAGGSDPSRVPTCGTWTGSTQGTANGGAAASLVGTLTDFSYNKINDCKSKTCA